MSIGAFVPSPEAAAAAVGWVRWLRDSADHLEYPCLETGMGEATTHAVRELLGDKEDEEAPVLTQIRDPMPVGAVLERVRRTRPSLLSTVSFELPEVDGKAQTARELVRSSPCQTFGVLFGDKDLGEVKRIVFVATGQLHDRSTLRLVNELRKKIKRAGNHSADRRRDRGKGRTGGRAGDQVAAA